MNNFKYENDSLSFKKILTKINDKCNIHHIYNSDLQKIYC